MEKSLFTKEYKYFIQVFVDFRAKAGLLQTELAKKLNVPQSYISKIETGQRRVDIIELRKICPYLKTNLVEFAKAFERKIKESRKN